MIPAFKIGFRIKVALWFVTVLVFVALISGLIYAVAGLVFKGRNVDGLITYSYGEKGSRMSEYQVSSSEYVESGKAFIDFSRIASDCGFTVSADEGEIKYIIDNGSNDSVKFYYGSRFAFVNGFAVFLSENVRVSQNGHVLVPEDFITGFVNGVEVSFSKSKISVEYDPDEIGFIPNKNPIPPIET